MSSCDVIVRACAPIVSPLKNAAGTHAALERTRREEAAVLMMVGSTSKRSSKPFETLNRSNFRLSLADESTDKARCFILRAITLRSVHHPLFILLILVYFSLSLLLATLPLEIENSRASLETTRSIGLFSRILRW